MLYTYKDFTFKFGPYEQFTIFNWCYITTDVGGSKNGMKRRENCKLHIDITDWIEEESGSIKF